MPCARLQHCSHTVCVLREGQMPSPASQSKRAARPAPFISSCHCSFCPPFVWSVSSSLGFQLVVMKGFGVSVMQPSRIIPFDEFSQTGWNVRWSKLHSYIADRQWDKFQVEKVWHNIYIYIYFFLHLYKESTSSFFVFNSASSSFWILSFFCCVSECVNARADSSYA